jgi:uncharacterized membrane protein
MRRTRSNRHAVALTALFYEAAAVAFAVVLWARTGDVLGAAISWVAATVALVVVMYAFCKTAHRWLPPDDRSP